jgi:hypothetical protein
MVGRGAPKLGGDNHLGVAPAHSDEPHPTGRPAVVGVAFMVDFDPEGTASGDADAAATR